MKCKYGGTYRTHPAISKERSHSEKKEFLLITSPIVVNACFLNGFQQSGNSSLTLPKIEIARSLKALLCCCFNHFKEVVRSTREVPPAHYTFKVDSFSLLSNILSKSEVEKYESDMFEAGGYKW